LSMNRGKGRRSVERGSRLAIPNDPANASDMRSFVGDFMTQAEIAEDIADEILMAVGEVVANACRHGLRTVGVGEVDLRCEMRDAHVVITVTDDGHGFDVSSVIQTGVPDLLSSGGRGFFLMRQLMDRVDVDSSAAGTTVVLERKVHR
jgi:anti-sigma regulatory factor (Ser/Thr protein kinase)